MAEDTSEQPDDGEDSDVWVSLGWAEDVYEDKEHLIEFLDYLSVLKYQSPEEVQDTIRELVESEYGIDAFYFIYYSLSGFDPFLDDLEELVHEEAAEFAIDLQREYRQLNTDFAVVYSEHAYGRKNGLFTHQSNVQYDRNGRLMISYRGFNGNVQEYDIVETPENLLNFAATILESVERGLDKVEEEDYEEELYPYGLVAESKHIESHLESIIDVAEYLEEELEIDVDVDSVHGKQKQVWHGDDE